MRKMVKTIKSQSELLPAIIIVSFLVGSAAILANQNITGLFASNSSNTTLEVLNETSVVTRENTLNETEEMVNETFPPLPELSLSVGFPQKITRGDTVSLKAIVVNTGSKAKSVIFIWHLPPGFEITSGEKEKSCGTLETNSSCVSEIVIHSSLSTQLGKNEIKVLVSYEA